MNAPDTPTTLSMFSMDPSDPLNDLRMSERARPLYEHVKRFIAQTVDPMAEKYEALGANRTGEDRWTYAPGQLDLLDAAKAQAKKEGLWNFFLPDAADRRRPVQPGLRLHRRRAGQEPDGQRMHELLGPRHRQHGSAGTRRHAGAEGAVAEAAAQRRDPLGLCDDRGAPCLVRRAQHRHQRAARRQRMGHQRREALHLRRRQPALQDADHDGAHQPRGAVAPAAVDDPGAQGHAGRQDHRRDACLRRRPCAARPHAHRLRQRARAQGQHPARRRPRLRDQPGAAGPGAHPPLHAQHRPGREGAGR